MSGKAIADWLRPSSPYALSGHTLLRTLRPFGVGYDEESRMLSYEGLLHEVRLYTPRELMMHPQIKVERLFERHDLWFISFEIAQDLHRLLWPVAKPPSVQPGMSIERGFALDIESIAQRRPFSAWDIDLDRFGRDDDWLDAQTGARKR